MFNVGYNALYTNKSYIGIAAFYEGDQHDSLSEPGELRYVDVSLERLSPVPRRRPLGISARVLGSARGSRGSSVLQSFSHFVFCFPRCSIRRFHFALCAAFHDYIQKVVVFSFAVCSITLVQTFTDFSNAPYFVIDRCVASFCLSTGTTISTLIFSSCLLSWNTNKSNKVF